MAAHPRPAQPFLAMAPLLLAALPGCFDPGADLAGSAQTSEQTATGTGAATVSSPSSSSSDPGATSGSPDTVGDDEGGTTEGGTTEGGTTEGGTTEGGTTGGGVEDTGSDATTTTETGGDTASTGLADTCPAGVEGCVCDLGATCDGGLYCGAEGLCLFEGMLSVPSGEFEMGCNIFTDAQCQADEFALHTVDIAAFQIGRTEVSQAEYAVCVAAGECDTPTQNYDPVGTPNLPVVRVNWSMAQTYCAWQGSRLPTEAEWAKAARGTDSRKYPWGNAIVNCMLANYNVCAGSLVDVDSYAAGASPYGVLHMVGNVGEWVSDWYEAPFAEGPVLDPIGPNGGTWKVTRSQPFSYGNQDARASFRSNWAPSLLSGGVGMRCARDLVEQ